MNHRCITMGGLSGRASLAWTRKVCQISHHWSAARQASGEMHFVMTSLSSAAWALRVPARKAEARLDRVGSWNHLYSQFLFMQSSFLTSKICLKAQRIGNSQGTRPFHVLLPLRANTGKTMLIHCTILTDNYRNAHRVYTKRRRRC